jgi:hypothetical protein
VVLELEDDAVAGRELLEPQIVVRARALQVDERVAVVERGGDHGAHDDLVHVAGDLALAVPLPAVLDEPHEDRVHVVVLRRRGGDGARLSRTRLCDRDGKLGDVGHAHPVGQTVTPNHGFPRQGAVCDELEHLLLREWSLVAFR